MWGSYGAVTGGLRLRFDPFAGQFRRGFRGLLLTPPSSSANVHMRSRSNLNQRLAQLEATAAARKRAEPAADISVLSIFTPAELAFVSPLVHPDGSERAGDWFAEAIRRLSQEDRDRLRGLLERAEEYQRNRAGQERAP